MNSINLIGRLTKTPEIKTSSTGKNVCRFTLAVDRLGKDEADFISCVAFEKAADNLVKYKTKGEQIAVEGRLQTGSYERNGVKTYTADVMVNNIEFIGVKKEKATTETTAEPAPKYSAICDDDIPF